MSIASGSTARNVHGTVPGEPGIWFFAGADLSVFSIFFLTYSYYFAQSVDLYLESQQQLNVVFGAVNTLLLLTSSWCVVLGVTALKSSRRSSAKRWFASSFALGACFVVSKGLEYTEKFKAGLSVRTDEFFMFYFMLSDVNYFGRLATIKMAGR
ncbi:MAG: hypothetical protein RLP45_12280 [Haliea sp.]